MRTSGFSPAFAIDLVAVKDLVEGGIINVQEGVERMEHPGELAPVVKAQLRTCLGRIAAGVCPNLRPK